MKSILIVEDDEMLRESYELILSTEKYEVHSAVDGDQALKKCKVKDYDLILLDLMMPIVDGTTFLEKYKNRSDKTKIIVMSNLSSGDALKRALELGAIKNVLKADLSPRQLISMVRFELQDN